MISIRIAPLSLIFFCISLCLFSRSVMSERPRVMVVMSYSKENPWCEEIKEGIDSVLAGGSELIYFYMNTKVDIEGGERKAQEAHDLFKRFRPDGVIAADDNAQWLFVVPYLKDKVAVPVMFCGVNAEPERYGYPASNISGILERGHILESLALAKQLVPSIRSIAFVARESPTGRAIREQVNRESSSYP